LDIITKTELHGPTLMSSPVYACAYPL
jgi:hypothetical protein